MAGPPRAAAGDTHLREPVIVSYLVTKRWDRGALRVPKPLALELDGNAGRTFSSVNRSQTAATLLFKRPNAARAMHSVFRSLRSLPSPDGAPAGSRAVDVVLQHFDCLLVAVGEGDSDRRLPVEPAK